MTLSEDERQRLHRVLSSRQHPCTPSATTLATALAGLVAVVVTLSLIEIQWLSDQDDLALARVTRKSLRQPALPSCEPITIRVEDYPEATSKHSFNDAVRRAGNIPAPRFRGNHTVLCQQAQADSKILWSSCLPITARNYIFCHQADRNDIVTMPSRQQLCYASVLHLLTADVYDVFRSVGAKPVLLYGSLLGAVRNGSIIPFTEDTDIGFQTGGYAQYTATTQTSIT